MQILFIFYDLCLVNNLLEFPIVQAFDTLPALHANVALEVGALVRVRHEIVHFAILLLQVGAHRVAIKLAFVHLESETDLSALLGAQVTILVQIGDYALGLSMEEVAM